jgi:hypothetical protein
LAQPDAFTSAKRVFVLVVDAFAEKGIRDEHIERIGKDFSGRITRVGDYFVFETESARHPTRKMAAVVGMWRIGG